MVQDPQDGLGDMAFQKAREYLPEAKLLLNENNIINDNAMTDKYLDIIIS